MILPIGKGGFRFRSIPWATLFIILFNLFIHMMVIDHDRPIYEDLEKLECEYVEFWLANPFLEFRKTFVSEKVFNKYADRIRDTLNKKRDYEIIIPKGERYWSKISEGDQYLDDMLNTNRSSALYKYAIKSDYPTLINHFTHFFIHGSWAHLFWNMLFFFLTAPFLEELWGKKFFLLFYIFSGIASQLGADFFRTLDHNFYSFGASGAVSGVIGAFLMRFWDKKLTFLWWGLWTFPFKAPGWIMIIFEIARQLIYAVIQDISYNGGSSTGFWAHFSGLVFGVVVVLLLYKFKRDGKTIEEIIAERDKYEDEGYKIAEKVTDLVTRGHNEYAYRLLEEGLKKYPLHPDIVEQLWHLGKHFKCNERNVPLMQKLIKKEFASGKIERAKYFHGLLNEEIKSETREEPKLV